MKILYFTNGQSPHDLRFMNSLAKTNHQIAVLCLEGAERFSWPEGVRVVSWPGSLNKGTPTSPLRLARYLRQIAAEFQPDVIHAGPIQRVAFIAALAQVRPLLSMSWGSDLLLEADQNPGWRWRTRFTLKRSAMLAADCQTVVKKAAQFGFHGAVCVFPWGVDLDHFTPTGMGNLRKKLGWENQTVLLCCRAWEPLYGADLLARAFVRASQANPQLRLLLFGKGSQEARIRGILKDAEATGKVYFGGFAGLAQLPDIYRSSDVYLSASHSDGSSVSLMEALACGIPAVVSDIPSNREWIEPNKQGWLFPDGNVQALTALMLNLPAAEGLEPMSIQARRLAEERADWKKNFAILLDAYQMLAKPHHSSKQ
jgi:glycosyltransferase involved in cell wall biosynthesis